MSKINNQSQITSKFQLPDTSVKETTTLSNISSIENMSTSFLKQQESSKMQALRGETLNQTLTLSNESEFEISNINIKEIISSDGTFKTGTVKIDNISYENFDIIAGFNLPNSLMPNKTTVITFDVEVKTETVTDLVNMVAVVGFEADNLTFEENANVVAVDVLSQSVEILKTANKRAVIKGQTITFNNVITNNGTIINTDVTFKDILPEGTEFVQGSVKIDDVEQESLDPTKGFAISNLNPLDEIKISFDVLVKP